MMEQESRNLGPLTTEEREELAQHERTLNPEADFWSRGMALTVIRDKKLYRSVGTFEDYLARQWGFSKSRAYQLIQAAEVMDDLTMRAEVERPFSSTFVDAATGSTIVDLPQNEGQARALVPIPRDQRRSVWARVLERVCRDGRGITAEFVENVVNAWLFAEERVSRPKRRNRTVRVKKPPSVATAEERLLNAAYAYGAARNEGDRAEQTAARKIVLKAAETLYRALQAEEQEEWEDALNQSAADEGGDEEEDCIQQEGIVPLLGTRSR